MTAQMFYCNVARTAHQEDRNVVRRVTAAVLHAQFPEEPKEVWAEGPGRGMSSKNPASGSGIADAPAMIYVRSMVPIRQDAIVMSLCSVCGQRVGGSGALCAHHAAVSTDSWAAGNRIMCNFFHRGIAPPRVCAADRIDDGARCLAETA